MNCSPVRRNDFTDKNLHPLFHCSCSSTKWIQWRTSPMKASREQHAASLCRMKTTTSNWKVFQRTLRWEHWAFFTVYYLVEGALCTTSSETQTPLRRYFCPARVPANLKMFPSTGNLDMPSPRPSILQTSIWRWLLRWHQIKTSPSLFSCSRLRPTALTKMQLQVLL